MTEMESESKDFLQGEGDPNQCQGKPGGTWI